MTNRSLPLLAPDAEEARRLLREELEKAPYVDARPGLLERVLTDVLQGILSVFDGVRGLDAGLGTLVVAIGAAVLIAVAIVLIRPRLNARGRTADAGVFQDGARRSAAHHRDRASACASVADWNGAVAEVLRAVIRSAEERVLVAEQPGRTATEAALHLGAVFPACAGEIGLLSDLFNETHYGSGTATERDYRQAAGLDQRLETEDLRRADAGAGMTAPAVPR
ncbi:DUF4129 domain-containing protein [Arthrobacter agilis]|uniref:DUF4129 domain-containing protein n=1 Tax=Arthrobacter agilis TaxID=37921 RepID=UPI002366C4D5|nr:DUF4129 domain-containing protein [Arthrobacter agilis]WDF32428.1 DUF4129 domain-containing protein [Arthrobacter agilis]